MGVRRKAREAAVQMLYQMDISDIDAERAIQLFWENLSHGNDPRNDDRDNARAPNDVQNPQSLAEVREFADELVRGYATTGAAIDDKIREVSKHWRLERMSRVDRNIIRLGAYELMHVQNVPRRVTLNEAVELAKRFGNEESPSFVNGVLDRIADDVAKE